ncbi:hypothetical protein BVRB_5g103860 [Beta vulgaris subsp. vulgaris]|nr:hypothetical protein BVRB_5g103860 [Beta vulgaris subsp. vulgaris]
MSRYKPQEEHFASPTNTMSMYKPQVAALLWLISCIGSSLFLWLGESAVQQGEGWQGMGSPDVALALQSLSLELLLMLLMLLQLVATV